MSGPHNKQIVPATSAASVTPSDVTVFTATRSLWVGGSGNINVRMADGTTILFSGVAAGSVLPLSVDKVLSTSTTATLIISLY